MMMININAPLINDLEQNITYNVECKWIFQTISGHLSSRT